MHSTHRSTVVLLATIVSTMLFIMLAGCELLPSTSSDVRIVPAAQFIIGSSLLPTSPVARTPRKQAALYRDLQSATGMKTIDVLAFLSAIRNNPETAKQLYDSMQVIITPRTDTAVHYK